MRLEFSPKATRDLEDIGDYIARDNPGRAVTFVDELRERCRQAAEMPSLFPFREDLAPGLQMAVHGRYLIFFRVQGDMVRIERVLHGARNLPELF